MGFGKRLEALIQERGKKEKFSQAELSRLMGVSRNAVSKWVAGQSEPSIAMVEKIAAVLGVPAERLVSDDPKMGFKKALVSALETAGIKTRSGMAKALGVSEEFFHVLEMGERVLANGEIIGLCKSLGIPDETRDVLIEAAKANREIDSKMMRKKRGFVSEVKITFPEKLSAIIAALQEYQTMVGEEYPPDRFGRIVAEIYQEVSSWEEIDKKRLVKLIVDRAG